MKPRAWSALQYHSTRDSAIPLILVHTSTDVVDDLRSQGWEPPTLMFQGGHASLPKRIFASGSLSAKRVQLRNTVVDSYVYDGPIERDPLWIEVIKKTGNYAVLVTAGALHPVAPTDMDTLAALTQSEDLIAASAVVEETLIAQLFSGN